MLKKTLFINGIEKRVVVDPEAVLVTVLRNQMFLTGTKSACGREACGACTVILDGKAVKSCGTKMKSVPDDAQIITIEGIGTRKSLHPLQLAWLIHGTSQCGFCTPGFIVSAKALLDENANPTREEVVQWFLKNGNVCKCGDNEQAVESVIDAARMLRGEISKEELWSQWKNETRSLLKDGAQTLEARLSDAAAVAKVTGTMNFGADLGLMLPEGTLHIKLVKAQQSRGNILSVDTSDAEKMPGVWKVITSKDILGTNRINGSKAGSGEDDRERCLLCDRKVMNADDAVAMVLAYTSSLAEEAAGKVKLELSETPSNTFSADQTDLKNLSAEPDAGFAYLNERGKLMIHSPNMGIQPQVLAEAIGIPPEKLAIVKNPASCTSGYKFNPALEGLLGIAALITTQPVYLEL